VAVVVIWGPPLSGKTTYINDRARPQDAVIDFNLIAAALSTPAADPLDPPKLARELAYRARRAAVKAVMDVAPRSPASTAWVVDSGASPQQLADWRARGAQVVVLEVALDECLARAAARPPGTERTVRAWFAKHRPAEEAAVDAVAGAEPAEAGQVSRRW